MYTVLQKDSYISVHEKNWRPGLAYYKGQTKPKYFFQTDVSSKKRTNEFDFTTMIPQVDLFSFIFWKKLKTPKRRFEINWSLAVHKIPYLHYLCLDLVFFYPNLQKTFSWKFCFYLWLVLRSALHSRSSYNTLLF